MISTKTSLMTQWADLQIHALNPDPEKLILLRGEVAQLPALEQVAEAARRIGAQNIEIATIDTDAMAELVRAGDQAKILEFHRPTSEALSRVVADNGAVARLAGSSDLDLRSRLQTEFPGNFALWERAETDATQLYREQIAGTGRLPWLVGYAPAEGDAAKMFPDITDKQQAIDAAWDIAFRVNLCHEPDPIAAWEALDRTLHARCEQLRELEIAHVLVTGHGTKVTVGFSELAQFIGGSKQTLIGARRVNNNRPSFEVFTAPHRDRVDGVIRATVPFLCDGVLVDGLELVFENGKITRHTARVGQDNFGKHISNPGANQLGEFALVDKNTPIEGVPFTYQTLIEENRSCHVAVGQAYRTNVTGSVDMSEAELNQHGVNRSRKHTDFMWSGPETSVIAVTRSGKQVAIIENGEFVGKFAA